MSSDRPQTPEAIALVLFEQIKQAEAKNLGDPAFAVNASRQWILETYRECIRAVRDSDNDTFRPEF